MGEVEANRDIVTRHDLRHDRHTVTLLTDHLVFSPKYRGKVLEGEVAEAAEEIIRETGKELDIEIIDMAGKW
jgi:REP element-mobilizing transposase RayT